VHRVLEGMVSTDEPSYLDTTTVFPLVFLSFGVLTGVAQCAWVSFLSLFAMSLLH
jgi:hypothetical protein